MKKSQDDGAVGMDDQPADASCDHLAPMQLLLHREAKKLDMAYVCLIGCPVKGTLYLMSNVPPNRVIMAEFLVTVAHRLLRGEVPMADPAGKQGLH